MLTNNDTAIAERYEEALKLIAQDTAESLEKGLGILKDLPAGYKDSENLISEVIVKIETLKNQKKMNNVLLYGGIIVAICIIAYLFLVFFPNRHIQDGDRYLQQGDFIQAIEAYEAAGSKGAAKLQDAQYQYAMSLMMDGDFEKAAELFTVLGDYRDSADMLAVCNLKNEIKLQLSNIESALKEGNLDKAIEIVKNQDVLQSSEEAAELIYEKAVELFDSKEYKDAYKLFSSIPEYSDSKEYITKLLKLI